MDCFISGLKEDIKGDVLSQCPTTLLRAVSLAKLYEDRYTSNFKSIFAPTTTRSYNHSPNTATPTKYTQKASLPPLFPTPNVKQLPPLNRPGIKRMNAAEMQLTRDKGLCYWCDDKFSFNHKCPNRKLMFLQLDEDYGSPDSAKDPNTNSTENNEEEQHGLQHSVEHHLPLNTMKGITSLGTIWFRAQL